MTTLENTLLNNPSQICAIIEDDNSVKGRDLFRAVLKYDAGNEAVKKIHLVSAENPPEYYLDAVSNSKVTVYNLFQDPHNWLQANDFDCGKLFERIISSKDAASTVMIDSLNLLLLLHNVNHTCSIIHKLRRCFKKIVCLIHADEITCNDVLKSFKFLSNVYLTLHTIESKGLSHLLDQKKSKVAEGIYVKPNGKMTAFREIFHVDKNHNLHHKLCQDDKPRSGSTSVKDSFKNITTFRLGLDIMENEKKARDNLVLPYLRSNKGDDTVESGEGKIIYYAESGDDLEEDPDDDLDI